MRNRPSVAIVIPYFRSSLSQEEMISLHAWKKFLSIYETCTVSPPGLAPPERSMKARYFDKKCFSSIQTYSELLLTQNFYQSFTEYEYILIYQLDALVFSDRLPFWCNQNLSYIGAPWFHSLVGTLTSPSGQLRGGNGGLSLRRVSDFLQILETVEKEKVPVFSLPHRGKWLQSAPTYPFNEDGFWSFEAPKYDRKFNLATREQSLAFAFETEPEKCFEKNGRKLPFGVHAWEKYDKEFWTTLISSDTTLSSLLNPSQT